MSEQDGTQARPINTQARPIRVSVELPERFECIGIIRRMARAMLEHCQAHIHDVDAMETIIGELCGNAARHAQSECGWYHCSIEHHGDHVVVTVTDQGIGFDPQTLALPGTMRLDADGSERHGGFGLLLVKELVDQVEFKRSTPRGTTVRVEKRLKNSSGNVFPSSAFCG